jgi:hypothetical protein
MAQASFQSSGAQAFTAAASPRSLLEKVSTAWHRWLKDVCDPYQPERHYMRGPGPKWRARQQGHGTAG